MIVFIITMYEFVLIDAFYLFKSECLLLTVCIHLGATMFV